MLNDNQLEALGRQVASRLGANGLALVTAESCTGGWIAKVLTDLPGSSHWFERGFVTYSNAAKQELLGVSAQTLELHGAVSEQTVQEMAAGALAHSHAQVSVAVSGIAGPGGATVQKPLGTVCFAWSLSEGATVTCRRRFDGDREAVRRQAVAAALQGVLDVLDSH